ncbi:Cilia- and flagella-associated protein 251 [Boothiomyces macroporosus]|uniref:Cilia- and flagella-associated protein 251 n=1 Tax=Boothiomyces macroporosus TaxID=261099 RepID=A0AAD5UC36_9FUNG|nr:Cilia- and flagella-associated protein 251 [Boothiomyces macroporosus]
MIVVWEYVGGKPEHVAIVNDMENMLNAIPLKSLYNPHSDCGVITAEFTSDNKHLISLGNDMPQTVCVWDWTSPGKDPVLSLKLQGPIQNFIRVNPLDPLEFMTFSADSVYFYAIEKDMSGLKQFEPMINSNAIAGQAVVGTANGDVILFADYSLVNLSAKLERGNKCAIKNLSIHNSPVTVITTAMKRDNKALFEDSPIPELIVATANAKVYLLSKSLTASNVPFRPTTATTTFSAPQTASHSLAHIGKEIHEATAPSVGGSLPLAQSSMEDAKKLIVTYYITKNPEVTLILEGQYGNLKALIVHPEQSKFAVGSDNGVLQVWDYNTKQLVVSRQFTEEQPVQAKRKEKKQPQEIQVPVGIESLCYSKSGKTLAVGFANGIIRFLDATNLQDLTQTSATKGTGGYSVSTVAIKKIAFSVDGNYCAFADANHVTGILHKEMIKVKPDSGRKRPESPLKTDSREDEIKRARQRVEWVFIGRRKTHYKEIIALLFTTKNEEQVLYSVSKDRHVTEYNLPISALTNGIEIKQIHFPEAATLYQNNSLPHPEEFILTFNSGFKFKMYSKDTQLCRSTTIGPTFGGLINSIQLIPHLGETKYFIYSTGNILGMAKFPLDGNPYKFIGVIAHPFDISNIAVASNGSCVLSAGGKDGIVNLWTMNYAAMEIQINQGGEGMEPFLNMLDPSGMGDQGQIYREFEDYFYLAQIKTQGEHTTSNRVIKSRVPLSEIPSLVQAMGFYPSNQEIDDMINEVKYSTFAQANGKEATDISLHELIKLYLNHRPEVPVSAEDIEIALSHGKRLEIGKPKPVGPVPKIKHYEILKSDGLFSLLQQFGNYS